MSFTRQGGSSRPRRRRRFRVFALAALVCALQCSLSAGQESAADTWTQIKKYDFRTKSGPVARQACAAVLCADQMLLFGGFAGR